MCNFLKTQIWILHSHKRIPWCKERLVRDVWDRISTVCGVIVIGLITLSGSKCMITNCCYL